MSELDVENLSEIEVEAWFRCLSIAQYRDYREPWDVVVDYQLVSELGKEDENIRVDRSPKFLEKLFEFFMVRYGVYDLSQFKYFLRRKKTIDEENDCSGTSLEDILEVELCQHRRATIANRVEGKYQIDEDSRLKIYEREKQHLLAEVRNIVVVIGADKILHSELWKLVGLVRGFTLDEYREVLREGLGNNLILGGEECDYQEIVKELDFVGENAIMHGRETPEWNQELSYVRDYIQTVSKLICFQTLASQGCMEYMTKRLCKYFKASESMKLAMEYIKQLAHVMDESTLDDLNFLRERHFSDLHNFVVRKKEMLHLKRVFGAEAFCGWSKTDSAPFHEEYFIQDNMLAIYHGIRQDMVIAKVQVRNPPYGKVGAIKRVIEELCNSGTVSRADSNREWRMRLLLLCMDIGRDGVPPKYLHTSSYDFSKVHQYVLSLAVAGM